ncbi:DUF5643 domain-containing protein [Psychrobacillus sp. FSL K6-2836]|uniref:DUF5643 domain-containing protein n=1 Tax=Psychrobacillus sp. FSL K6-2836 TaxID=2921548 RepID=UPI0030FBE851
MKKAKKGNDKAFIKIFQEYEEVITHHLKLMKWIFMVGQAVKESFIVPNQLKRDSFNFSISFDEFNGNKGNWNLNIPITKIEGESFLVMDEATSKDYKIRMKKVTFTSATTEINFDLTEPINAEELNQIIRFHLYDDKGNMLKEISAGGGGCSDCENIDGKITLDTSVQYEPLKHIPDYLIIEPYISSTSENIDELRMEIPLKESE